MSAAFAGGLRVRGGQRAFGRQRRAGRASANFAVEFVFLRCDVEEYFSIVDAKE